jgi:hypothetical protein
MKALFRNIFLLVLVIICLPLYSQTDFIGRAEIQYLSWGGVQFGWNSIYSFEEAVVHRGSMGRYDVRLADNSTVVDENIEFFLHFNRCEKEYVHLDSEYYQVKEVNIFPSQDIKKFGERAAGFLHHQNTIEIKPLEGSLFSEKQPIPGFTIDFYIRPSSIQEGSTVFSWHAPVVGMGGRFTGIQAFFKDQRLYWLFENVFQDRNGEMTDIFIGENNEIRINEWHHHALYYNADSGLLTLFYDGKESNLAWVTETGSEDSTLLRGLFSPYLAIPFTIGDNYYGYIDEFRISRGKPQFFIGNYREHGEIKSDVLSLNSKGTKIVKLFWESIEDMGTAVRVFYRISDSYFLPYSEREEAVSEENSSTNFDLSDTFSPVPDWIQVRNGVELKDGIIQGKYFQWKAELYGTEEIYTPYLLSLSVMLELDHPPEAPTILKAVVLDGGVELSWISNKESDINGYKVYYGTSSRFYFGKSSNSGDSPIFAGNVDNIKLRGLNNESVYFISITAVDNANQESGFSNEVIVRPSSIYSNGD